MNLPNPVNNAQKPYRESLNRHIGTIVLPSVLNDSQTYGNTNNVIDDFRRIGENKNFGFKITESPKDYEPWIEDFNIVLNNGSIRSLSNSLGGEIQGGNIITVEKPNGQDGYLIGKHTISKIINLDNSSSEEPTESQINQAKELIANYLNIDLKDIIWIDQTHDNVHYHIDCFLTGLGKGTIAINNPREAIFELEKVKKKEYNNLSAFKKWSIDKMLEKMKADLPESEQLYSSVKNELKKNNYKIIEVPGIYYKDTFSKEDFGDLSPEEKQLFLQEFGNKPTNDPNIENNPNWYGDKLPEARINWHMKNSTEPIINYMNSVVGANDAGKGWMITNASNSFPSLNQAFEDDMNKEHSGINYFEFIQHGLLQLRGGVQCITNELPK